jgi:hypothetical protein
MLVILAVLLVNALAYYVCVGIFLSAIIFIIRIISPGKLDFTLVDHFLLMFFWASVLHHLILRESNY